MLAREVVASARSLVGAGDVDVLAGGDRLVRFRGAGSISLAKRVVPVREADGTGSAPTSGPYYLDSFGTTRAVLRRRNGPAVGLPETVELIAIPDLDNSLDQVRSGRVDALLEADERTVADVIARPGPAILALPDTARIIQILGTRRSGSPSGDCVAGRIDREALAKDVYGGLAQPGRSIASCTLRAKRTLLRLLVNAENRLRRAAAEQIVAGWVADGIDARLDVEPWPTFVARLADGAFDAFLISVRDTEDTARVVRRICNGHLGDPPIEVTSHAPWAVLTPLALARVPVLVALCGGEDQC